MAFRLQVIWMMGSSLVYWAHRRAVTRPIGMHLGLEQHGVSVRWHGRRGMQWDNLIPIVVQQLRRQPPPNILLIHLGSNDLARMPIKKLLKCIHQDLLKLKSLLPSETLVVWSDILQRRTWWGATDDRAMERKRRRFNRFGGKGVADGGGCHIKHDEISIEDQNLFRDDGVHLSDIGNDIFLNSLQGGLEAFITKGVQNFQN
ncbi:uncharacterized protein [Haliotis asinina]|uniref:uncharacterized protein n=1 Tax=Haliotis asinina TaxID=109174 RepID=UPI003531FD29